MVNAITKSILIKAQARIQWPVLQSMYFIAIDRFLRVCLTATPIERTERCSTFMTMLLRPAHAAQARRPENLQGNLVHRGPTKLLAPVQEIENLDSKKPTHMTVAPSISASDGKSFVASHLQFYAQT